MPDSTDLLLLFPAFLIGTGLGGLFTLGILAKGGAFERNAQVLAACAGGSACGVALAALTESWWPPLVGPFVLSIGASVLTGLLLPRPGKGNGAKE
jgi:hypothetical protein